jgi:hypothetical protein
MIVQDASHWVFAGTGLNPGDQLPGVVGYEFDQIVPNLPVHSRLQVLTSSPVRTVSGQIVLSSATIYTAESGAIVFNAATIEWSWGLDAYHPPFTTAFPHAVPPDPRLQRITSNVLANLQSAVKSPTPGPTVSPMPTASPLPAPTEAGRPSERA